MLLRPRSRACDGTFFRSSNDYISFHVQPNRGLKEWSDTSRSLAGKLIDFEYNPNVAPTERCPSGLRLIGPERTHLMARHLGPFGQTELNELFPVYVDGAPAEVTCWRRSSSKNFFALLWFRRGAGRYFA